VDYIKNHNEAIPLFPITHCKANSICQYVLYYVKNMQVPLELPSTIALGVLASYCQRKTVVRIGAGYFEPLNLLF
jgi:hypothetical protein